MEAVGETVLSENTSKSTRPIPEDTAVLKNVSKAIEPAVETIINKIVFSTETKNGGNIAEPEVS